MIISGNEISYVKDWNILLQAGYISFMDIHMMTSKQAIPVFADKFGVAQDAARVIDRNLANGDLRHKHKGPYPPAYTREEAFVFLMACATARYRTTKAAEIVTPSINARARITAVPGNFYKPDPEHDEEFGAEYGGPILTYQLEKLEGQAVTFLQFMLALMSDFQNEDEYTPLTITLSETGRTIEVETDGGFISQTFRLPGYAENAEFGLDMPQGGECAIEHKTIIYWHSVQAIIKRTADPFAGEDE